MTCSPTESEPCDEAWSADLTEIGAVAVAEIPRRIERTGQAGRVAQLAISLTSGEVRAFRVRRTVLWTATIQVAPAAVAEDGRHPSASRG